jgi:hypothetical protein
MFDHGLRESNLVATGELAMGHHRPSLTENRNPCVEASPTSRHGSIEARNLSSDPLFHLSTRFRPSSHAFSSRK